MLKRLRLPVRRPNNRACVTGCEESIFLVNIIVEDPDGTIHDVPCRTGLSLMEAIRWAGLPLRSSCGGVMACGTCHVVLDEQSFSKVGGPGEEESGILDTVFDVTPTSRLSCQIVVDESIENLRVKLLDPWR